MTATPDTAAALLIDLTRRGIDLHTSGDRLRYRPRSAMTPDLAERVKAHKPTLLVMLAGGDPGMPETHGTAEERHPLTETPADPRATPDGQGVPHELSLAERVKLGYVNPGWTPAAWAERLRQLADHCEALRPELAAQYQTWARNVQKDEK